MNKFQIIDSNGNSYGYINSELIKAKAITDDVLEKIKNLHIEKHRLFAYMKEDEISNTELKCIAIDITDIEYQLQDLWGFPRDPNYHGWYLIPKCTCPKMDNHDRRGTRYRIISGDCIIHGIVND